MTRPRPSRFVGILLVAAGLFVARPGFAQPQVRPGEPQVPEKAGKELSAYYVGDTPPRIDGRLDDEIWSRAQAIDDLVQNAPDNMTSPSERTVVKVAYDDRSILCGRRQPHARYLASHDCAGAS